MADVYVAKDGDEVDYVAWKYYGRADSFITDQIYAANVHLADYGVKLPAGVEFVLPDIVEKEQAATVNLWN